MIPKRLKPRKEKNRLHGIGEGRAPTLSSAIRRWSCTERETSCDPWTQTTYKAAVLGENEPMLHSEHMMKSSQLNQ